MRNSPTPSPLLIINFNLFKITFTGYLALCLYIAPSKAQTGPGGLGNTIGTSNLRVWLDAADVDGNGVADATAAGTAINSWKTLSGYTDTWVQAVAANQPVVGATATGSFRSVNFSTVTNQYLTSATFPNTVTSGTLIMVGQLRTSAAAGVATTLTEGTSTPSTACRYDQYNKTVRPGYTVYGVADYVGTTVISPDNTLNLVSFDGPVVSGTNRNVNVHIGNTQDVINVTASVTANQYRFNPNRIGSTSAPDGMKGHICEMIGFTTIINTAQVNIVESYLQAKYSGNSASGQFNIAQDKYTGDNNANGNFDFGVIGIGKESTGNQVESTTYGLTIDGATMASFANGDYLMAGVTSAGTSGALSNYYTSDINASGLQSRWERIFYLDATKAAGNFNTDVAFDFGAIPLPGNYVLLKRNTNTAGTAWTTVATYGTIAGNSVTFSAVPFSSTSDGYYTIGRYDAPGGVVSGITLWLKADASTSTTTNGAALATWSDNSCLSNNAAQATVAKQPLYLSNGINYNPAIDFNGTTHSIKGSSGLYAANFYLILKPDNLNLCATGNPQVAVGITHSNGTDGGSFLTSLYQNKYRMQNASTVTWQTYFDNCAQNISNRAMVISLADNATTSLPVRIDGMALTSPSASGTYQAITNRAYALGSQRNDLNYFDGKIAEVIAYNLTNSNTNRNKIESYLALKYGISLGNASSPVSYTASDGTVIWNANATYQYNVTGIGRDDVSGLNQKQSQTVNGGDILSIGLGAIATDNLSNSNTFASDIRFLMWGNNNAVASSIPHSADLPTGVIERLNRVWKVIETGETGNLEVRFNLTGLGSVTPSHLRLLIDKNNNGVFTDETVGGGGVISGAALVSGSTYRFTGVNLNNNNLFSLGSTNLLTPLPIELLTFKATNITNNYVALDWSTGTETNNDYFTIEKSKDGITFEFVTNIKGQGTTSKTNNYNVIDDAPFKGLSYYRLKQTDFDAKYSYSWLSPVNLADISTPSIELLPNPSTDGNVKIKLNGFLQETFISVTIYNNVGALILSKQLIKKADSMAENLIINDEKLAAGIYLINCRWNDQSYSKKLLVVN